MPVSSAVKGALGKQIDLIFTFGLFGILLLLVIPIPSQLMDLLLAMSLGLSLLVLLIVIYVKGPSEFSVFPTVLLAVTLFRLGLNVASTRLILLEGFAGNVIESFGQFVVQGNYVVGIVVFIILVVINFVVITKGAGRIAEVAARFTLDAMPGKQMAIDAELNAGIIDERTAKTRRERIQREAEFYGAMDGASKFVRGDAVAGILITFINICGGIAIGVAQMGLPIGQAMQKFSILSIGDGIISQVPALIISVAAGILTTRTSDSSNLASFLGKQLTFYPRALTIAAVMMAIFALMPGLPFTPFALLAIICGTVVWAMKRAGLFEEDDKAAESAAHAGGSQQSLQATSGGADDSSESHGEKAEKRGRTTEAELRDLARVEPFAVEIGFGLLSLIDDSGGGDLLDRISGVRRSCASQLGIVVPPAAVRDNVELEANQYRFLLREKVVGSGSIVPNRWMAMNVSGSSVSLKGVPTVEPVFGIEAVWIAEEERKTAEINGYTVVDAPSVLITHLAETLKDIAPMLLEREYVQKLIDGVKEDNPTLVNELFPDVATVGLVQRVLHNLLGEQIPIRHLSLILEAIADYAPYTKNPDELTEHARRRLGAYFVERFEAEPGKLRAMALVPQLENALISRVRKSQFEVGLAMDPGLTEQLLKELEPRCQAMNDEGLMPLIIVSAELRLPFRRFFEPSFPRLNVLAYQEIPPQTSVETFGLITAPDSMLRQQPVQPQRQQQNPAPATA